MNNLYNSDNNNNIITNFDDNMEDYDCLPIQNEQELITLFNNQCNIYSSEDVKYTSFIPTNIATETESRSYSRNDFSFQDDSMDISFDVDTRNSMMDISINHSFPNENQSINIKSESVAFSTEIISSTTHKYEYITERPCNNQHIVIDGLNFLLGINSEITKNLDKSDLMNVRDDSGLIENHHFSCDIEVTRVVNVMVDFFNIFPNNSTIHLVLKRFGSKKCGMIS